MRITRSARKHGIGNARIKEAVNNAGVPTLDGDALLFVGRDATALLLEVVVVPDYKRPGEYAVLHAMPADWRRQ